MRRLHLRRLGLAIVVACPAAPAAAQNPWGASYYPYVLKGPNEKLSVVLHYRYAQLADYYERVPFTNSFSVDAGANADGGRFAVATFRGPLLADGWRVYGEAGTVRQSRWGYFGLGNDAEPAENPPNPQFDRVRRLRHSARADLTRRIVGPLQVSVGGGVVRTSYSSLPGISRFEVDCSDLTLASGPGPFDAQGCAPTTDWVGRASLVLDLRDNEFVTAKGVLLEGGVLAGSGGDNYGGVYGLAQGYVTPREGTVIAARLLGRYLESNATLDARSTVFAWERSIPVVGGPESHRGFVAGRLTGREVLLANLEVRHDILNLGDYGAITAIGFLDGGRARERVPGESKDLHWGGGAGLALRILRSTILTFNWGWSKDGYQFAMGTGWMF
jgi:outer membrane protein assembly factor BamA